MSHTTRIKRLNGEDFLSKFGDGNAVAGGRVQDFLQELVERGGDHGEIVFEEGAAMINVVSKGRVTQRCQVPRIPPCHHVNKDNSKCPYVRVLWTILRAFDSIVQGF